MGQSGIITESYKGKENTTYHDIAALFKIYRAVSWNMQIRINQLNRQIQLEYGTDVDDFLNKVYQAGMDIDTDIENFEPRVEIINRSNQFLKLIDEAVDLVRKFHPHGERYYWVLYYSYMSPYKAENIDEVLDELEPHFPKIPRIHRTTYFRWRDQALDVVGSVLWGYERESRQILTHFKEVYEK
ncbi:MAG: hypothetical protein LUI87_16780 [Lachnospiraceae bacterium]|nr:hypothetical protein [Lachnospiraceae bacterium]